MTDNEIIKALECCIAKENCEEISCEKCPLERCRDCKEVMFQKAIDLINRQKAEIEKLNVELVGMRGACESYKIHYDNAQAEIERYKGVIKILENDVKTAKSEAIKEYREKVKAILIDKGIYLTVVKNALNEAEKEVITNERHT